MMTLYALKHYRLKIEGKNTEKIKRKIIKPTITLIVHGTKTLLLELDQLGKYLEDRLTF